MPEEEKKVSRLVFHVKTTMSPRRIHHREIALNNTPSSILSHFLLSCTPSQICLMSKLIRLHHGWQGCEPINALADHAIFGRFRGTLLLGQAQAPTDLGYASADWSITHSRRLHLYKHLSTIHLTEEVHYTVFTVNRNRPSEWTQWELWWWCYALFT